MTGWVTELPSDLQSASEALFFFRGGGLFSNSRVALQGKVARCSGTCLRFGAAVPGVVR